MMVQAAQYTDYGEKYPINIKESPNPFLGLLEKQMTATYKPV